MSHGSISRHFRNGVIGHLWVTCGSRLGRVKTTFWGELAEVNSPPTPLPLIHNPLHTGIYVLFFSPMRPWVALAIHYFRRLLHRPHYFSHFFIFPSLVTVVHTAFSTNIPFVPSFLHSFDPSFLPSFLRPFVPSFLPSFHPSFLTYFLPPFLPDKRIRRALLTSSSATSLVKLRIKSARGRVSRERPSFSQILSLTSPTRSLS